MTQNQQLLPHLGTLLHLLRQGPCTSPAYQIPWPVPTWHLSQDRIFKDLESAGLSVLNKPALCAGQT